MILSASWAGASSRGGLVSLTPERDLGVAPPRGGSLLTSLCEWRGRPGQLRPPDSAASRDAARHCSASPRGSLDGARRERVIDGPGDCDRAEVARRAPGAPSPLRVAVGGKGPFGTESPCTLSRFRRSVSSWRRSLRGALLPNEPFLGAGERSLFPGTPSRRVRDLRVANAQGTAEALAGQVGGRRCRESVPRS